MTAVALAATILGLATVPGAPTSRGANMFPVMVSGIGSLPSR
jgi:hypothetical protein